MGVCACVRVDILHSGEFVKYDGNMFTNQSTPYDYCSVLHYGKTSFSINGSDTMTLLNHKYLEPGQMTDFSEMDILEMNMLYNCETFLL